MPYGTIKIDTITFTDGGADKSVSVSGLTQNPTFSGNITVTGTVSGATVRSTTVSGVTVTGTTLNAASGVFTTTLSGETVTGTTAQFVTSTATTGSFASLTGTTTTGTTANFASGVFTTQISGAIVKAPAGTAGAPAVRVGTGATVPPGLYGAGTDQLGFSVGGSSVFVIDSVGQMRVINSGSAAAPALVVGNDLNTGIYSGGSDNLGFSTGGAGRLNIDSTGRILIGTSNPYGTDLLQVIGGSTATLMVHRNSDNTNGGTIRLSKARGGESSTVVLNGDTLGYIAFQGYDGSSAIQGASIEAVVDATPSVGKVQGRLQFATRDTSGILNERVRIDSTGRLLINTSSNNGGAFLQINDNRIRIATAKTPSSASDTGTTGEICWDANYIYVCTATNTWKRTAIATW